MCESILRAHGFHTGFYSSPHLISVCERIRLNGCILLRNKFAEHFHQVYNALYSTQVFFYKLLLSINLFFRYFLYITKDTY